MMVKSLGISDWHDLIYDELLLKEMAVYTDNMTVETPAGAMPTSTMSEPPMIMDDRAPPAIDKLPPFMKE